MHGGGKYTVRPAGGGPTRAGESAPAPHLRRLYETKREAVLKCWLRTSLGGSPGWSAATDPNASRGKTADGRRLLHASHHQAQRAALLHHVGLLHADVLQGAVAGGCHGILHLHRLQHDLERSRGGMKAGAGRTVRARRKQGRAAAAALLGASNCPSGMAPRPHQRVSRLDRLPNLSLDLPHSACRQGRKPESRSSGHRSPPPCTAAAEASPHPAANRRLAICPARRRTPPGGSMGATAHL